MTTWFNRTFQRRPPAQLDGSGNYVPLAVVYFITHLLRIETEVADGEKLSEFLHARK